jgi:hypothetical protein
MQKKERREKTFSFPLSASSRIFHNLGLMTVKIRSRLTRGVVIMLQINKSSGEREDVGLLFILFQFNYQ